jgi:2-dehydro-3-deoxyphosphogluconate aldolase/(4S)-4-hydroxy-2-oxoglutarate aldolase
VILALHEFPAGIPGTPGKKERRDTPVSATDVPASALPRVPMSEALATTRVVAILRAENASRAEAVVDVLLENGIRSLELTLTTTGALNVVERLATRLPAGTDLGVGTVLTADEVDRAVGAGARFVVSPSVVPAVIEAAARHGIASYPGAFTPTEIHAAWNAGASAVKLFPAGALGPGYLKAVRAPLPDVPLVPTGGVDIEAVGSWLAAGAVAVGLGSPLIGDALTSDGDLGDLAGRARSVCAAAGTRR